MEVFLIFPKSKQAQQELGQELAKFQSEQALKSIQKLPCSTEQKLELVDTAVKHLKAQQSYIANGQAGIERRPARLLLWLCLSEILFPCGFENLLAVLLPMLEISKTDAQLVRILPLRQPQLHSDCLDLVALTISQK